MNVIVAGSGRPVQYLGQAFLAKGHSVTVVNPDPEECARLSRRLGATVVRGDASDRSVLEEAGARSADVVLAATPADADNLVVCQLAHRHFGVERVVALANDPENEEIFRRLGVESVSTSLAVANLIEQRTALGQVTNLILAGDGDVQIAQVQLEERSPAVGRTLSELGLPREALIAVLMRQGATVVPRGATLLAAGDRVLLVAVRGSEEAALRALTGRGG